MASRLGARAEQLHGPQRRVGGARLVAKRRWNLTCRFSFKTDVALYVAVLRGTAQTPVDVVENLERRLAQMG